MNPLKQGLKHYTVLALRLTVIRGKNSESIKTRIETYPIIMYQYRINCKNSESIKTRIETFECLRSSCLTNPW